MFDLNNIQNIAFSTISNNQVTAAGTYMKTVEVEGEMTEVEDSFVITFSNVNVQIGAAKVVENLEEKFPEYFNRKDDAKEEEEDTKLV